MDEYSVSHLTHQLGVDLGDAIDGVRPLHTQLRGGVPGRGRTKGTDRAGDKHTQTMFGCNVYYVMETYEERESAHKSVI